MQFAVRCELRGAQYVGGVRSQALADSARTSKTSSRRQREALAAVRHRHAMLQEGSRRRPQDLQARRRHRFRMQEGASVAVVAVAAGQHLLAQLRAELLGGARDGTCVRGRAAKATASAPRRWEKRGVATSPLRDARATTRLQTQTPTTPTPAARAIGARLGCATRRSRGQGRARARCRRRRRPSSHQCVCNACECAAGPARATPTPHPRRHAPVFCFNEMGTCCSSSRVCAKVHESAGACGGGARYGRSRAGPPRHARWSAATRTRLRAAAGEEIEDADLGLGEGPEARAVRHRRPPLAVARRPGGAASFRESESTRGTPHRAVRADRPPNAVPQAVPHPTVRGVS